MNTWRACAAHRDLTSVHAGPNINVVAAAVANVEHIIPATLIGVLPKNVVAEDFTYPRVSELAWFGYKIFVTPGTQNMFLNRFRGSHPAAPRTFSVPQTHTIGQDNLHLSRTGYTSPVGIIGTCNYVLRGSIIDVKRGENM